jgi:hypothetical protein
MWDYEVSKFPQALSTDNIVISLVASDDDWFIFIIIIIGMTALGGPWPSWEVLPIRLCWGRLSSNS